MPRLPRAGIPTPRLRRSGAATTGGCSARSWGKLVVRLKVALDQTQEGGEGDRLGDVVVTAGRPRCLGVFGHGVRADGDNWRIRHFRARANAPRRFPAIQ